MATATTSAAGLGRVRLVRVCGETARRRATLVRADRPRLLRVDVALAARDSGSTERDMDGAARPDPVRGRRGPAEAARPDGVLRHESASNVSCLAEERSGKYRVLVSEADG